LRGHGLRRANFRRRRSSHPRARTAAHAQRPGGTEAENVNVIETFKAGPKTPEALEAFIAAHKFPLVEGPAITFVYRGEAEAVHLKHWVFGLPSSQPLARVEGTNLFYLTLVVPTGSRIEYKLEVVRGGKGEWIEDPLNPARASD